MPMTTDDAISTVRASVREIIAAISESNAIRLRSEVTGYLQALVDCGLIDEPNRQRLILEADIALERWSNPDVHLLDSL